jgi:hypothetical protein
MATLQQLKAFYFTDDQIDFLLRLVRNHSQYEDESVQCLVTDFANQIEDQIVNHSTND